MPNFLDTLSEFYSHGSTQVAEDWLAAIEGVAWLHRLPDAFRIETARSRMTVPRTTGLTEESLRPETNLSVNSKTRS